jgi:SAM-dependent methyltransferase
MSVDKNFIKFDQCVICSSNEYVIDFLTDPLGNKLNAGRCLNCGHLQVHNYFSDQDLGAFYSSNLYRDTFAHPDGKPGAFHKQLTRGERIYKSFKRSFQGRLEVLEIGCGLGAIGKVFIENKHSYLGVDLNDEYLSYGRREISGVDLKLINNFSDLRALNKKFDLIIFSHVVEHLKNPKEVLEIVESDLLKDDGLVYVEVPSLLRSLIDRNSVESFIELPHVSYFTLHSLNNLMRSAGFCSEQSDHNLCCLYKKSDNITDMDLKRSLRHSARIISLNNFLNIFPSKVKKLFKFCIKIYLKTIKILLFSFR